MKKIYENYVIYGLLILAVLILLFSVYDFSRINGVSEKNDIKNLNVVVEPSGTTFESINSGSTESGDVSIELTPLELNEGQLKVELSVNTHSVDLSPFDLKQITTLEYDGIIVKPISAPSLGGHHASGELIFKVEKNISKFTIKIGGIPKVDERVFTWNI